MTRSELENTYTNLMKEAFTEFTSKWTLPTEDMYVAVASAMNNEKLIERMANIAELFAAKPERTGEVHAHVEQVVFPSGKDIKIVLTVESSMQRKQQCALLSSQDVVLVTAQMDLPFEDNTTTTTSQDNPAQTDIMEFVVEEGEPNPLETELGELEELIHVDLSGTGTVTSNA